MNTGQPRARGRLRGQAGFTLLELAVCVVVGAALAGALLQHLSQYRQDLERGAMLHTVDELRAVLRIKVAELQARGQSADIAGLAGQNPMDWLPGKPANYLGEFATKPADHLHNGNWYFDSQHKNLIFMLRNNKIFAVDQLFNISFTVESSRLPAQTAKPAGAPLILVSGVALVQVEER